MKQNKSLFRGLLVGAILALGSSLSAQTFALYLQAGNVFQSNGSSGDFGTGLNAFYVPVAAGVTYSFDGVVAEDDINLADMQLLSYTQMVDGALLAGPGAYASATAPAFEPVPDLGSVLVVWTDAPSVGAISAGSQFGVAQTAIFNGSTDNRNVLFPELTVLAGTAGSIQLTNIVPVPEPSTFALLGGVLALGFVMYRRRRA